MPRHAATTRKAGASTKKATATSTPRKPAAKRTVHGPSPVGITQIAREALMDALSAVLRGAQRALAAARDVGTLAWQALRQLLSGATAGLGEVFGTSKPAPRRAAART